MEQSQPQHHSLQIVKIRDINSNNDLIIYYSNQEDQYHIFSALYLYQLIRILLDCKSVIDDLYIITIY